MLREKEKHPRRKRDRETKRHFLGDHKADEISNMENKQIEKNVVPLAATG